MKTRNVKLMMTIILCCIKLNYVIIYKPFIKEIAISDFVLSERYQIISPGS